MHKEDWGNQGDKGKAGYEYLLAYKITVPIYDYTVEFCKKYFGKLSSKRTQDQMVQAARSGSQNILEGNQQASLEGYIKLVGVNSASLEELLRDYLAYARQNKVEILGKEDAIRGVREIGEVWGILKKFKTLPDNPDFPNLPKDETKTLNLMLTLIHQAIYLQKQLRISLEKKFITEGGFREKLFQKRREYKYNAKRDWGDKEK